MPQLAIEKVAGWGRVRLLRQVEWQGIPEKLDETALVKLILQQKGTR
jgi:hypothetical protein